MVVTADTTYRVGDWGFSPQRQELERDGVRVRLEHRTAALLAYLCERRGEVVPRNELIAHVWGSRQVSANSLPTVMHDLRRALGDNAKQPRYLETVSKNGYRLVAAEAPADTAASTSRARSLHLAAVAATIVIVGLGALVAVAGGVIAAPRTTVIVTPIENATGNAAYDTITQASEGVMLSALNDQRGLRLQRGGLPRGDDIRLDARLVLWSGLPDVVFEARDANGAIVYSGFAFGEEAALPAKIRERVGEFAEVASGDS